MKFGDWDWLVIVGLMALTAGVGLLWGPGASLACVGVALIVAGVGGAIGKRPDATE